MGFPCLSFEMWRGEASHLCELWGGRWRVAAAGRETTAEAPLCQRRGKSTSDPAINRLLSEMRGINTFEIAENGQVGEMRGINTFEIAENGQVGEREV
ncbi:hypothetical protein AMQ84_23620 [Paenibacillus riograndensis]|uniref:Uncharacterized protein n=1 Tax=Paenibacillus riograndensis TaxID=483937 RepID=A0A132TNL8_9BACL|nr:hypothetical protein AMQ84_23620 [Paenibacillus riograndensis]